MLSTDTGALRDYGRDPYGSYLSATGYYFEEDTLFPVRHVSDRYGDKEVVVGVRDGSDRFAILKDRVRRDQSVTIGPTGKLVAEWDDRLDAAVVRRADTAAPADFMDAMWFAWHASRRRRCGDRTTHRAGPNRLCGRAHYDRHRCSGT